MKRRIDMSELKDATDAASVMAAWGAVLGFLPSFAALLSIVWTAIRIYEYFRRKQIDKEMEE